VHSVADALATTGLPAHCLTIEVTETAVLADDGVMSTLQDLRDLGSDWRWMTSEPRRRRWAYCSPARSPR
jgi:predicted signal transduction protein with EAL and GGDEF domain